MNGWQKNTTYPPSKLKTSFTRRWIGWKNIYKEHPAERWGFLLCKIVIKFYEKVVDKCR
jgi:hypothetical protein